MTTETTTRSAGELSRPELKQTGLLHQSMAIVRRNLRHIKRQPEALTDVTIQPVMFVVLFAFVFGGSIQTEGSDLPRVAAAGDHGPDDGVRVVRRRHRPQHRHRQGHRRPVPLAADLAVVGADRPQRVEPDPLQHRHRRHVRDGPGHRLAHHRPVAGLLAYGLLLLFGFAMIWIGILVGRRCGRSRRSTG